jgi:hypothetical protein
LLADPYLVSGVMANPLIGKIILRIDDDYHSIAEVLAEVGAGHLLVRFDVMNGQEVGPNPAHFLSLDEMATSERRDGSGDYAGLRQHHGLARRRQGPLVSGQNPGTLPKRAMIAGRNMPPTITGPIGLGSCRTLSICAAAPNSAHRTRQHPSPTTLYPSAPTQSGSLWRPFLCADSHSPASIASIVKGVMFRPGACTVPMTFDTRVDGANERTRSLTEVRLLLNMSISG